MFWIKRHLYYQIFKGKVIGTFIEQDESVTKQSLGFNHPRTIIGDFFEIESCFTSIAEQLTPKRFLQPSHIAVIHFLEPVEGGLTNIEVRALREAAFGAGCRESFVPKSTRKLTKTQILNRSFQEWHGV